jgi:transposase
VLTDYSLIEEQTAQMTLQIKQYDLQFLELTQTEYPETQALLKAQGVGHITALTSVLTLGGQAPPQAKPGRSASR